jgi:preprotein translocase subunit SecD
MLYFAPWKKVMILLVCLTGIVVASPNLFYGQVEVANDARKAIARGDHSAEAQVLAETWPDWAPSGLVNLGLDLRGGAHLLVEVAVADVHAERIDQLWQEVRPALRDQRDSIGAFRRIEGGPGRLVIRLDNAEATGLAQAAIEDLAQPVSAGLLGAGGPDIQVDVDGATLTVTLTEAAITAMDERTMAQSLEIVRRRVDETGTREPTIQRQGRDRILIQVPGIGSAEELLAIIGKTAKLTFQMVDSATASEDTRPGPGKELLPDEANPDQFYVVERRALISGDCLTDAQPGFDQQSGEPVVTFRFNATCARIFGKATSENVGRPFAIVLDGYVISAPVIREPITGGSGQISGSFTVESATNLAILLRAGALPAEIQVVEQRTVGPDLGQDSVNAGRIASMVAFAAVLVFMVLSYGLFGIFADIALLLNVALIFAALSAIGATLTLPGIAGLILTIGMAVDANVLIFERIREEMKGSRGPARAIELGYEKALTSILDANITTFIAAVILFTMGSGPVRGFSVTLGIGIITSVFTAVVVTRLMVSLWFGWRRPKTVTV